MQLSMKFLLSHGIIDSTTGQHSHTTECFAFIHFVIVLYLGLCQDNLILTEVDVGMMLLWPGGLLLILDW